MPVQIPYSRQTFLPPLIFTTSVSFNFSQLVKIHGLDYFYQQNDNDPEKVRARLEIFRRLAKEQGLSSPLISGGVMPGGVPSPDRMAMFDFVTT